MGRAFAGRNALRAVDCARLCTKQRIQVGGGYSGEPHMPCSTKTNPHSICFLPPSFPLSPPERYLKMLSATPLLLNCHTAGVTDRISVLLLLPTPEYLVRARALEPTHCPSLAIAARLTTAYAKAFPRTPPCSSSRSSLVVELIQPSLHYRVVGGARLWITVPIARTIQAM